MRILQISPKLEASGFSFDLHPRSAVQRPIAARQHSSTVAPCNACSAAKEFSARRLPPKIIWLFGATGHHESDAPALQAKNTTQGTPPGEAQEGRTTAGETVENGTCWGILNSIPLSVPLGHWVCETLHFHQAEPWPCTGPGQSIHDSRCSEFSSSRFRLRVPAVEGHRGLRRWRWPGLPFSCGGRGPVHSRPAAARSVQHGQTVDAV